MRKPHSESWERSELKKKKSKPNQNTAERRHMKVNVYVGWGWGVDDDTTDGSIRCVSIVYSFLAHLH